MNDLILSKNIMPSLPQGDALTDTEVSNRSIWINRKYAIKECYVLAEELIRQNTGLAKQYFNHTSSRLIFTEVIAIIVGSFAPFTGPINDNAGNEVIADGEVAPLGDLLGMQYLVEGVIGEIPSS